MHTMNTKSSCPALNRHLLPLKLRAPLCSLLALAGLSAALTAQAALIPKAYIIGAEDVIQVWVIQQGISGQYTVRVDGMISVAPIGDIRAAGLTTSQLQAVIADRLEARGNISHPSVTVGVVTVGRPKR